jgi:5-oxoprolinase (ATP-hydrolysing) subunit C
MAHSRTHGTNGPFTRGTNGPFTHGTNDPFTRAAHRTSSGGAVTELEIASAGAPAMVQDGGRPGRMHQGVPRGGPMVPDLLGAANASLGNAPGTPALECFGELRLNVSGDPLWISVDGEPSLVTPGVTFLVLRPAALVARYVAFRGALDVPEQLGGRGALPVAGIGRILRKGDRLRVTPSSAGPEPALITPHLDLDAPVRALRGPDLDRFGGGDSALAALTSSEFTVSPASDRTGTRLTGATLPRTGDDRPGPTPMTRGAIQVPGSGEPIVLGPDHPVTGGYPVVAVVIQADWGRIHGRRPGARVRFRLVDLDEARAALDPTH